MRRVVLGPDGCFQVPGIKDIVAAATTQGDHFRVGFLSFPRSFVAHGKTGKNTF